MIPGKFDSFQKITSYFFLKSLKTSTSNLLALALIILFSLSCSSTKRFTKREAKVNEVKTEENTTINITEEKSETEFNYDEIRVSMQGLIPSESLTIESPIYLYDDKNKLALDKVGNKINCYEDKGKIILEINEQNFDGEKFVLVSAEREEIIKINGKKFRGKIQISSSGNSLEIVNVINLEDYVKGVLAKEMPLGRDSENFEALKALAVCIRTYAIQKMKDGKIYFDIYADTRDQVYGGMDAEKPISNMAVDETKKLILKFNGEVTDIFYHSTCGGYTESSANVFTKEEIPYLNSIKDGEEPNCNISPRFKWEENYSKDLIIDRLKSYSLLENRSYDLEDVSVISRFSSGRVNELEIVVVDDSGWNKSVILKGNEIRNVIRNSDGKNILWSTMFDVELNSNSVLLSGKGFGHGVGLCQWGAISLSRHGWDFREILDFYFPGTDLGQMND